LVDTTSPTWLEVQQWAEKTRRQLVEHLIAQEDNVVRGRIQQLDELLTLPATQEREIRRQASHKTETETYAPY